MTSALEILLKYSEVDLIAAPEATEKFNRELNNLGGHEKVMGIEDDKLDNLPLALYLGISSGSISV